MGCRLLVGRRGRDSNPRPALGGYTLSRRASSTTPAPLRLGTKLLLHAELSNNKISLTFVARYVYRSIKIKNSPC